MAPSKILAIKIRALGDTVLMTAPLLELAHAFPESELHVAVDHRWASLLESVPHIHRVWPITPRRGGLKKVQFLSRMAIQFRKEKFDCVINFHASPSTALLARATGAPTRSIHFHGHDDSNRHSSVPIPGKGTLKPIVERDMDTIRALGLHIPAGRLPAIRIQSGEVREAERFLEKLNLTSPILGINLGASRPTKSWPTERYASLAVEWCKNTQGSVLALAGPDEGQLIQNFLKRVDDDLLATTADSPSRANIRTHISATDQLNLRALAAVLSRLSVVAGNDSGPKHLAVAVGTPTVTLFGPEDPFEWHPYPIDQHPYIFVKDLSCRRDAAPGMPPWCGLSECSTFEHQCMRLIGVDQVLTACQKVTKRSSL